MTDAHIRNDDRRGRLGFAVGLVAILVLVAVVLIFVRDQSLMSEDGPIEILSAAGYVVCIALMFRLRHLVSILPFVVTLLAMGLRELDMDKRPFTEGLLKSRQYIGDTVGPVERIVSLVILLGIIAAVVTLIYRHGRTFLAALKRANGAALCVAGAIGLVVVSKSLDGLGRKLEPLGITITEAQNTYAGMIEETLELGIPLMLGIAILAVPVALVQARPAHGGT